MRKVHFWEKRSPVGTACGNHNGEDITKVNESVSCPDCLQKMIDQGENISQAQIDENVY